MATRDFKYAERLSGRTIRLLKIKSIPPASQLLEVELQVHHLDHTDFEALSYVWGDPNVTFEILCNGQRAFIGQNLHEALMMRRNDTTETTRYEGEIPIVEKSGPSDVFCERLWVDALCINQADETEKTLQVRMMKDIYCKARQVMIWLGNFVPGDFEAISLVSWLYDQRRPGLEPFKFMRPAASDFHPQVMKSRDWECVFRLLSHPWFGRAWIVQELLLSQCARAQRGPLIFDMSIMLWIAYEASRHRDLSVLAQVHDVTQANALASIWMKWRASGPLPLQAWAKGCISMQATDPRDKIFALVGISHSVHPEFIDYKKSFLELAIELGSLALTPNPAWPEVQWGPDNLAFTANPRNRELGLPCWVPDYFSKNNRSTFDLAGQFMTLMLRDQREVAWPNIRGIDFISLDLQTESTTRSTMQCAVDDIAFEVSKIDCIEGLVLSKNYELPEDTMPKSVSTVLGYRRFGEVAKTRLPWILAARRLANPSISASSDILDGHDFEKFLTTLHYGIDLESTVASVSMRTSFCCWILCMKYFLAHHKNIGEEHFPKRMIDLHNLSMRFEWAFHLFGGWSTRNFFVSKRGRLGWAPLRSVPGDEIFIFKGSRIPFIARPDGHGWEYIGPCYVNGLMNGEAWDLPGNKWWFMRLF